MPTVIEGLATPDKAPGALSGVLSGLESGMRLAQAQRKFESDEANAKLRRQTLEANQVNAIFDLHKKRNAAIRQGNGKLAKLLGKQIQQTNELFDNKFEAISDQDLIDGTDASAEYLKDWETLAQNIDKFDPDSLLKTLKEKSSLTPTERRDFIGETAKQFREKAVIGGGLSNNQRTNQTKNIIGLFSKKFDPDLISVEKLGAALDLLEAKAGGASLKASARAILRIFESGRLTDTDVRDFAIPEAKILARAKDQLNLWFKGELTDESRDQLLDVARRIFKNSHGSLTESLISLKADAGSMGRASGDPLLMQEAGSIVRSRFNRLSTLGASLARLQGKLEGRAKARNQKPTNTTNEESQIDAMGNEALRQIDAKAEKAIREAGKDMKKIEDIKGKQAIARARIRALVRKKKKGLKKGK